MNKSAIISSKGQVVIPQQIRKLYSLSQNTRVIFEPAGEVITMRPLKPKFTANLEKKLAQFEVDPNFRKDWETSLNKKLKKWGW